MTKVSKTLRAAIIALFASLLFVNCGDYDSTESDDSQKVDYDLRGTWVRTEAAPWLEGGTETSAYGEVVLDYSRITITGPVAHLNGFTRKTTLEAYTEGSTTEGSIKEGKLYIKDQGEWQAPILYRRWDAAQTGPYPADKMLTLKGGGVADETFKRTADY